MHHFRHFVTLSEYKWCDWRLTKSGESFFQTQMKYILQLLLLKKAKGQEGDMESVSDGVSPRLLRECADRISQDVLRHSSPHPSDCLTQYPITQSTACAISAYYGYTIHVQNGTCVCVCVCVYYVCCRYYWLDSVLFHSISMRACWKLFLLCVCANPSPEVRLFALSVSAWVKFSHARSDLWVCQNFGLKCFIQMFLLQTSVFRRLLLEMMFWWNDEVGTLSTVTSWNAHAWSELPRFLWLWLCLNLSRSLVFSTVIITSISFISLLPLPCQCWPSIDLVSPPEVLGIIGQFSQSQWISGRVCERKQLIAKAKTDCWWTLFFSGDWMAQISAVRVWT